MVAQTLRTVLSFLRAETHLSGCCVLEKNTIWHTAQSMFVKPARPTKCRGAGGASEDARDGSLPSEGLGA